MPCLLHSKQLVAIHAMLGNGKVHSPEAPTAKEASTLPVSYSAYLLGVCQVLRLVCEQQQIQWSKNWVSWANRCATGARVYLEKVASV